jgi:hypothetical protein
VKLLVAIPVLDLHKRVGFPAVWRLDLYNLSLLTSDVYAVVFELLSGFVGALDVFFMALGLFSWAAHLPLRGAANRTLEGTFRAWCT